MSAAGRRFRRELLDTLDALWLEYSYPPSLRELARHFGKAPSVIYFHLFIFSLVVEIKQITGTLTPAEIKVRDRIQSIGGLYCVVRFTRGMSTRCHNSKMRKT